MPSYEDDNSEIRDSSPLPNNCPEVVAQAYGPNRQPTLRGTLSQTDRLDGESSTAPAVSKGRYFEGQKSYIFLLDSDGDNSPDQLTHAYSLIYTVPEATKSGPVHSNVGLIQPNAAVLKATEQNGQSGKSKHYHFEGTVTIPKVRVKEGSLAGQEVTVQFSEPDFQFPFQEDGFSANRVHKVKDRWVQGKIIPSEKSPKTPVVDGYLYLDE